MISCSNTCVELIIDLLLQSVLVVKLFFSKLASGFSSRRWSHFDKLQFSQTNLNRFWSSFLGNVMMINKREHAFPIEHQLHLEVPTINHIATYILEIRFWKIKPKWMTDGNPEYNKDDKRTNAGRIRKSSSSQFWLIPWS